MQAKKEILWLCLETWKLGRAHCSSGPGEGLTFTNSWQLLWFWGVLIFFHPLAVINEFSEGEFKTLVSISHRLISVVVTIWIFYSLQCYEKR